MGITQNDSTSDCASKSTNWHYDENVANHLFRLSGSILESPGLIAARWSDKGVLQHEEVWSFEKLQSQSLKCVSYLKKQGIKKGDRVLLMVRPGLELIVICFALFRLGSVPIVIDPGMGLKKFRAAVVHSKPTILVGIPVAVWMSRLFRVSFCSIKIRVLIKTPGFFKKLRNHEVDVDLTGHKTLANDLAAILFTSGSTGAPKGVCYEHGMFNAQIRLLKGHLSIKPGEVDLPMLPIFALFNPAMGMTTVIPEINPSRPASVNPAKIVAAIKRYGVSNSFGSPVLWRKIGDYCHANNLTLPSLRRILVAGAAAPTQLYRQFEPLLPNGMMYSPYGATECLPVSIIEGRAVIKETAVLTDKGKGICVGKPLSDVSVRIVEFTPDGSWFNLKEGSIGEIMVHGPSVTTSYDGLPDVNAKSKVSVDGNIWHRMGDMGYFDEKGRLWFCGRKVEQVISGDRSFFTECVEGLFLTHPDVKRCAMIARNENSENQSLNGLALVIEPVLGRWPGTNKLMKVFAKELLSHLNSKGIVTPVNSFFFQKKLPVDVRHNAKIHRLTLRRKYQNQPPIIVSRQS